MPKWTRRILSERPLNAETARPAFASPLTPSRALFLRNHGPEPKAPPDWRVRIEGTDRTPEFDVRELLDLPAKAVRMVLECAGNGRAGFDPTPPGVAWGEDAVGCVEFRGTPLGPLLRRAGLPLGATEAVFAGADQDEKGRLFERSLPLAKALHPDTLVAYKMNGRPIPKEHGGPIRLVVPGWFGVASVKWLRRVRPVTTPFIGHYQTESYVYRRRRDGQPDAPVGPLLVKSNIVSLARDETLVAGRPHEIWGWAWTGARDIFRVEVSTDGGQTWSDARVGERTGDYAWRRWSLDWRPGRKGRVLVMARATDVEGNTQPPSGAWNELGYGNNGVGSVEVNVKAKAAPGPRKKTGEKAAKKETPLRT